MPVRVFNGGKLHNVIFDHKYYIYAIGKNTDLNTFKTSNCRHCDTDAVVVTLKNCPTRHPFLLLIEQVGGSTYQKLHTYDGSGFYMRGYIGSKWTPWQKATY